ncbi:MAG: hypothetical protein CM15mP120_00770 [Pseudomonadota bacterium]|nr:MAG: hypothetical protein CM15mP120_00770 [Pseudomonadota bacterium]
MAEANKALIKSPAYLACQPRRNDRICRPDPLGRIGRLVSSHWIVFGRIAQRRGWHFRWLHRAAFFHEWGHYLGARVSGAQTSNVTEEPN